LLWIAASDYDRPRKIIEYLWNKHHVYDFTSRNFVDSKAANLISTVISRKFTGAQKWEQGPLVEMVFSVMDTTARELLDELESLMTASSVCTVDNETYYGIRKPVHSTILTHVLRPVSGTSDLRLFPIMTEHVQVDSPQSWSEWFVHGICFTTTQLALFFAIADDTAMDALKTIMSLSMTRAIKNERLRSFVETDKMEIHRRFAEGSGEDADVSVSRLTVM